ncbi:MULTISPECIES: phospholipase D-like domain-containing protein [Pseudomonas syringae group]|uniref:phospholipase D-like domain-containing protein n=1 Tax=Pseudomonas syringae group TaxID=136849 RepID=UPI000E31EC5C|nr:MULTISPECIES: phospholipase D family protein [Pseudomonas syringae group]
MPSFPVHTNGPSKDYVLSAYSLLLETASVLRLAAPYFNRSEEIIKAARRGATVQLLVGLNSATHPGELAKVVAEPNCTVHYFTDGFHSKVFIGDDNQAMLGSANLTQGGLIQNREATITLDQPHDEARIAALLLHFAELWDDAAIMTSAELSKFRLVWESAKKLPSADALFDKGLVPVTPTNVLVGSEKKSPQRLFLADMQKLIYSQYMPAFREVASFLQSGGYRRPELASLDISAETNRFLNWCRLTLILDDETWKEAPTLDPAGRLTKLVAIAQEWVETRDPRIESGYVSSQNLLHQVFGSPEAIGQSSQDLLTEGLLQVHAFSELLRFTRGGLAQLPIAFWKDNGGDVIRVKASLTHLLYGKDDFAVRICDLLWSEKYRLSKIGKFCSLELVGMVKPLEAPPINSRMAKALRFLGHDVRV